MNKKTKYVVHHGTTSHPMGAKCAFCDKVKRESMNSWKKRFEKRFYPYVTGGQGYAIYRFIDRLIARERKKAVEEMKGGE